MDRASWTHAGLDVTGIAPHDGSALVNRLTNIKSRNVPEAHTLVRGVTRCRGLRQTYKARGSGVVLSSHQPIDRRVSNLKRDSHLPEPARSTDLSFTPLTEILQRDCCHDDMEDH